MFGAATDQINVQCSLNSSLTRLSPAACQCMTRVDSFMTLPFGRGIYLIYFHDFP